MGFFKMGICPRNGVINPYSQFPQLVQIPLSADLGVGVSTLNFNLGAGTFPHPYSFIRQGDRVVIGPSTDDIYKGNHERRIVNASAIGNFTVSDAVDFAYDSGDPFTILGSNLPAGWVPSTNEVNHIEPLGMYNDEVAFSDGYMDKYRLYVKWWQANGNDLTLQQNLGDLLFDGVTYEVGCWYKYSETGTNAPQVTLLIDEGAVRTGANFVNATTEWTKLSFTRTTGTPTQLLYQLESAGVGGTGDYSVLYANNFYICHAKETDDASDGVYTFDDYPEFGSVQIGEITTTAKATLIDGSSVYYDSLGGAHRRPKFTVACRFNHVTTEFYQQLRILKQWQDQGNWVAFFHNTSDFELRGMPPMMVGTFQLSGFQQPSWDLSLVSFQFSFKEEA